MSEGYSRIVMGNFTGILPGYHIEFSFKVYHGNADLGVLGYTDHSEAHVTLVAKRAAFILSKFGYSGSDDHVPGSSRDTGRKVQAYGEWK